jgi:hypothetical protein
MVLKSVSHVRFYVYFEEYPIYSNQLPSFEYSIWECVEQSDFASNIQIPSGLALSNDGERLFVAERGTGNILVFDVATGDRLASVDTGFFSIGGMAFSPLGNTLYFVDQDTNTLNAVTVQTTCSNPFASRINPEFSSQVALAQSMLGSDFSLSPIAFNCTVDPTIPDAAFFVQVHNDTGYADDDPNVQSEMAGMDAAAALLANRTDCEYDSELNFDALLLGGYFCHLCLPEQDQTCDAGGICTNIQWQGYVCDNEFYIVNGNKTKESIGGISGVSNYLLTTANGTAVDPRQLILKAGMEYRFTILLDDEVCLSLLVSSASGEGSSGTNIDGSPDAVTIGCASRGPLVVDTRIDGFAVSQLFINVLGEPVFQVSMEEQVNASGGFGISGTVVAVAATVTMTVLTIV